MNEVKRYSVSGERGIEVEECFKGSYYEQDSWVMIKDHLDEVSRYKALVEKVKEYVQDDCGCCEIVETGVIEKCASCEIREAITDFENGGKK